MVQVQTNNIWLFVDNNITDSEDSAHVFLR